MISIEEHHIDAMAANASAIANGRKLANGGKFVALHVADDESIVFGECSGSGKSGYACSVDFTDPGKPVPRCSCPSRQIPCKHCLGLLYAYVIQPTRFVKAELPEELSKKRATAQKRAATKKAQASNPPKPKKVNVTALKKKLGKQLEALELLEKILADLLIRGLGTHGNKEASQLRDNAAMLRAAYLPGAELALLRLSDVAARASNARQHGVDESHHDALDELARLEALLRRGKAYITERIADPKLAPETDSGIAAWLGHAWQYDELISAGRQESAAEFVQLAFFVAADYVKKEYADTGIWIHLADKRVFHTETLRPYKAAKHIKAENSDFEVAKVPDFVRYPGDVPERVRWQSREHRALDASDYASIVSAAETDFSAMLKRIKNALKSPLGTRHPVALVCPARIGSLQDGAQTRFVIEDSAGTRIELADPADTFEGIAGTTQLLPLVGDQASGAVMLCLFHMNLQTLRLTAQPLTLIHDESMTRLAA